MCFSATASFTASAALAIAGIFTTTKLKKKSFLLLALIPWFFALQQFSEGVLWLYLPSSMDLCLPKLAKSAFLFFAFFFWPVWIPLSLLVAEKNSFRKNFLGFLLGIGLLLGCSLLFAIPYIQPIPHCFSIDYTMDLQKAIPLLRRLNILALISYALATILPMFISSIKKIWVLGILIGVSAALIYITDRLFFISLWCFFAAVFSLGLLFIIPRKKT